jgi:hypothetical protein
VHIHSLHEFQSILENEFASSITIVERLKEVKADPSSSIDGLQELLKKRIKYLHDGVGL